MASIHVTPKSRFYVAVFRDSNGKQIHRSTKVEAYPKDPDPKEAARLAREARQKARFIADTFERMARGEVLRESAIRETVSDLLMRLGVKEVKRQPAIDFFKEWLEQSKASGKSETTVARYNQVSRDFLEFLGDRAGFPIEEVSPKDVQDYVTRLSDKRMASKTITNQLKILKIPFAEACRLGVLSLNPAAAVKPPPVVSVERGTFTKEEIQTLLEACECFEYGAQWKTAILLAYYGGMRLGDATGLSWEAVDLHLGQIEYTPEKTKGRGRRVQLPLHPKLASWLEGLPVHDDPKACLTPDLKTPEGKRDWLSKTFHKLARKAGIDNPMEKAANRGRRAVSTKSFHSLRHSLASHLADAGVPEEVRMKFTGHSDRRTHAGYTHMELDTLRKALCRI